MSDPIIDFLGEDPLVRASDILQQSVPSPQEAAILVGAKLIADAIDAHTTNEEFFHEKLMECIDNAADRIADRLEKIYGEVGG